MIRALAVCALAAGCSSSTNWSNDAHIIVQGNGVTNQDCRSAICKHNENTDLTVWNGSVWLVHRTAQSQMLGPNSSLHVYQMVGSTFVERARVDAPSDRDIRDPHFFVVGNELHVKALARLAIVSTRDSDVDTTPLVITSTDGSNWTPYAELGPHGWSFWRLKQAPTGEWMTAAYQDGDKSVVLYRSVDGLAFSAGAQIYGDSAQTPLETELTFMPSGWLLALVRTDGSDSELSGDADVRTVVCWAQPPYDAFSCPQTLDGARLDGPVSFWWHDRLFVIARKHLGANDKKRTALYELTGSAGLAGGDTLALHEWGELPSAGDTSYAGVASLPDGQLLTTWYSGDLATDEAWLLGMYEATDIWQATLDLTKLK